MGDKSGMMSLTGWYTSATVTTEFYETAGIRGLDILFGVVFIVCVAVALVGNVTILLLLIKFKTYIRVNALIVLAVSLGISDVLMITLSGVPNIVSLLKYREDPAPLICSISGWVLNFNNRLNSFITTCICLVRCVVVVWPFRARLLLNTKTLMFMVITSTLIAILYSSLPYILSHHHQAAVTGYFYLRRTGFCMYFIDTRESRLLKIASTFLVEMVLFAPFIVSIVTCVVLLYTLKKKSQYIKVNKAGSTGDNKGSAAWAILRVTILTLICYTPMLFFTLYNKISAMFNIQRFNVKIEIYLMYLVSFQFLIYLRASINPFIIGMPKYLKKGMDMKRNVDSNKTGLTNKTIIVKTQTYPTNGTIPVETVLTEP